MPSMGDETGDMARAFLLAAMAPGCGEARRDAFHRLSGVGELLGRFAVGDLESLTVDGGVEPLRAVQRSSCISANLCVVARASSWRMRKSVAD